MYTVDLVGLVYLNICKDETIAVAPDGRVGHGNDAHYASIMIRAEDLDRDDWWPGSKIERQIGVLVSIGTMQTSVVWEFRLPDRATVTFACQDPTLTTGNVKDALPKAKAIDPQFELDTSGAIAEVPVRGGKLETLGLGRAALVRWTVEHHPDPIVIAVKTADAEKQITLTRGATGIEVVFANTPDIFIGRPQNGDEAGGEEHDHGHHHDHGHGDEEGPDHFPIYGRINKGPNGATAFAEADIAPIEGLAVAPFRHPYLAKLTSGPQIPNGRCVPICC